MFAFISIILTTIVIGIGTFFPGSGPLPLFATAWWFKVLGAILLAGSMIGLVMAWVQRKWTSAISHLGVIIMFAGVILDMRSMTEGETITTYNMNGTERPLGFALTLVGFHEQGYVSTVRLDGGGAQTIAPSHPVSYKGWLMLQESFDRTGRKTSFTLVAESGETLRVQPGERFAVPGRNLEASFDPDYVEGQDTLFRFRVFEQGREKATGFMSRSGIVPPTIRLGLRLLDFEPGGQYVSVLQLVKRPGAWLVFVSFGVMFIGLVMLARESSSTGPKHKPFKQERRA
jgi:hypothetical protein